MFTTIKPKVMPLPKDQDINMHGGAGVKLNASMLHGDEWSVSQTSQFFPVFIDLIDVWMQWQR